MGFTHRLTEVNILPKFTENLSKVSENMERPRNARLKHVTFNCDPDLGLALFSYKLCTPPLLGEHLI